ncbi:general secretion pathway protein L [Sphingomonas kaistensis]|uniref:General secretion pathway protein L n=1 Tax=Sphingomonas kaistensis TaxID=298708 RepID=A0A7X6BHY2_9SPHN|nr:type II secretion system protein GspL [Sphingomonas kaistensis]NJC06591.1 general secretion pathway protein L [Sphingomonas kaistensis]
MSDATLLLLPAVCDPADATACWWRLSGDAVLSDHVDADWRSQGLPLIALAPVASVRLDFPDRHGETARQAQAIARSAAIEQGMADAATLHAVAGLLDERLATAVVANGSMIEWLDWLAAHGADPVAILPAGALIPPSENWSSLTLGPDGVLARGGLVAPDEPAMRDMLVEPGEEVELLPPHLVHQRLLALAQLLPLNLRTGRFARRRLLLLDWRRLRELAALALLIPLLGLVMGLALMIRLDQDASRLEAETARLTSAAIGQEVSAAAAAAALDTRIGATPGASGSPFPPLAALYQQLQQLQGVTAVSVTYRPDGTLAASLAATRVEDINRLLLSLQRLGYRVTASTRPGASGQMIADLTLRSAE